MVGWWDGDGSEVSNFRLETETNLGRSGIGIFGRRDPKKNTIIGTLVPLEVKSSLKRMPEDIAYPCLVSIWTCKFQTETQSSDVFLVVIFNVLRNNLIRMWSVH